MRDTPVTIFGRAVRQIRAIGLRSYLRFLFARPGTVVAVPIGGRDIWLRKGTPDLRVAVSCLGGEFEPLRHLLSKDYDGVIVDAGGYIGTATLALREMFPAARIVVVEPSDDNLEILRRNLDNVPGIEIVQGALVGRGRPSVDLRARGTGAWGLTAVSAPGDAAATETLHPVKAVTLADIVGAEEEIGLLKLDIEGGEVELLQEDAETLSRIDIIFAELHERIVEGCEALFIEFSESRRLIKGAGEKYLSIRR